MNRHYSPSAFSRFLQYFLGLAIATLLSACGGGGGTVGLPTGTNLYTSVPGGVTLAAGAKGAYTVGGGTPTYTAASSNTDVATATVSGNALSVTAVAGGSATITVTDAAGAATTVAVAVTAAPVVPVTPPGTLFTTAAGTLTVATGAGATYGIGGGKAPYAVSSSNAAVASTNVSGNNFSVVGVAPGAAQIVVTDATGVSLTVAVTVGSGTPTPLYTTAPSAVTVAIGASASYAIGGGKPVYSVSSSNNAVARVAASGSDFIITGFGAGSAQVAVVDANGTALAIDVTVGTGGAAVALFTTAPANVTILPGAVASYAIGGGKPVYAVSSSNAAVAQVAINGANFIITGGQSGTAQVAVSDANGAMLTVGVTVGSGGTSTTLYTTAPSAVSMAVGATETYAADGGTAPYAVSSSNSAVASVTLSGKNFVIAGAAAGTAQISVFDANGSSVSTVVTVGAAAADKPLFTTAPAAITMALGDAETFALGGGKGPYSATSSNAGVAKVSVTGSTFTITGLTSGTAQVVLSDANGATLSLAVTVGSGSGPTALYTTAPSALTLPAGTSDGFIVAGGKAPYAVSTGNAAIAKIVLAGSNITISAIGAGTTQVAVFDSTGASVAVTVTVPAGPGGLALYTTAPSQLSVPIGQSDSFTVAGGTGPYTASTGNLAVARVVLAGGNFTIEAIGAGATQVTVFDSTGAAVTIAVTVPALPAGTKFFTSAPDAITLGVGANAVYTVAGGSTPYQVSSANAAVATIALAGNSFTITATGTGTTVLRVFDGTGAFETVTVTVPATPAGKHYTTAPDEVTLAAGTTAGYGVAGGTAPYSVSTGNAAVATISISGANITIAAVAAGSTTVQVFDSTGAFVAIAVKVPAAPSGAALFTTAPAAVTLAATSSTAYTVSGGSAPYTVTSSNTSVASAGMAGGTLTVSAVAGGTAKLTVTDTAGATVTVDVTVTQGTPSAVSVLPGSATGNVGDVMTFIVKGGTAPYAITVNNTAIATVGSSPVAATGGTFTVNLLNVGTTFATITDALGQTFSLPITAEQTSTVLRLSPNALTVGENDSSAIELNIFGGTVPYRAFTSDQTLSSVSTSGSKLTIAVGSNGTRCINPITSDGTYIPNGTFDITITTLDFLGASATSVLTIKDNGKGLGAGCP